MIAPGQGMRRRSKRKWLGRLRRAIQRDLRRPMFQLRAKERWALVSSPLEYTSRSCCAKRRTPRYHRNMVCLYSVHPLLWIRSP